MDSWQIVCFVYLKQWLTHFLHFVVNIDDTQLKTDFGKI